MRKWLIALSLICQVGLYADAWKPIAELIPPGSSTGVSYNVNVAYDVNNKTTVAAWADRSSSNIPFYAVYNGSIWTTSGTPIPLGASTGVRYDVHLSFNSDNNTVVAVWVDTNTLLPYYAIFDGTIWTTPGSPIPVGSSTGAKDNVFLAYNESNQTLVAAWSDDTTSLPYFAVFDGSIWVTTGSSIPAGTSDGVYDNVYLTYNPSNMTVIAAWGNISGLQLPYYSVFNGSSWTIAALIPVGTSTGVVDDVHLVYNSATQTVIAAWSNRPTTLPYYSIFNGIGWTAASPIPNGTSSGAYGNITLAYNLDNQTILGAWSDSVLYVPYYSIFNGVSWSTGTLIPYAPSDGINYDIPLSYNVNSHQMVAAWGNYPNNPDPYFQIYNTTVVPSSLTGRSFYNKFASQKAWVNQLNWTPFSYLNMIGYHIYRNGTLIATVNADTLRYNDEGRCRENTYIYEVRAFAVNGSESLPLVITLPSRN